ncbi:uncharacterized protein SOCE26_018720 [Sorangium cellulosum]|uniref:Uncharacterized protein n=1 Tax=Sorangium cellulosum TaxID=56 RepID=A0A2L0EME2_SORCE|nr:uncharacterized protein SOCE26_018720 [Sorangium cellulosum]
MARLADRWLLDVPHLECALMSSQPSPAAAPPSPLRAPRLEPWRDRRRERAGGRRPGAHGGLSRTRQKDIWSAKCERSHCRRQSQTGARRSSASARPACGGARFIQRSAPERGAGPPGRGRLPHASRTGSATRCAPRWWPPGVTCSSRSTRVAPRKARRGRARGPSPRCARRPPGTRRRRAPRSRWRAPPPRALTRERLSAPRAGAVHVHRARARSVGRRRAAGAAPRPEGRATGALREGEVRLGRVSRC